MLLVDGGEGIVVILVYYIGGQMVEDCVSNLFFEFVMVLYGMFGDGKIVFIEMVLVFGFQLLKLEE